jgi:hypothetical protein
MNKESERVWCGGAMTSVKMVVRYFVGGIDGTHGKCRDRQCTALNFNQAPPRERFAVLRVVFLKVSSFVGHYAMSTDK